MPNSKYTQDRLYILSKEIIDTYLRDYFQRDREGNIKELIKEEITRIKTENREIVPLIDSVVTNMGSMGMDREAGGFVKGVCIVYELFRRQAEANKLEKEVESR